MFYKECILLKSIWHKELTKNQYAAIQEVNGNLNEDII